MNRPEVMKILSIYSAAYPMAEINEEQIELWVDMLQDIPFDKGQKNIREHVRSNRFPPTIADIVRHDPNQFTDHERLQRETEERFALMDEWERKATPIPDHVRKRIEYGQKLLKRGADD